jgi:hypothetical protein
MSERIVSIKTSRMQRQYGDTYLRAEVDFHLRESQFGGAPAEQVAIDTVQLLWPTAQNVELSARPAPDARTREVYGKVQADRWIVRGRVDYRG